jgi:Uma2 family endonuclease
MTPRRPAAEAPHRADGSPNGRKARRVHYRSSDGKPMAETPVHVAELMRSLLILEDYFAADAQVYVGADKFLYYEEGNPRAAVAPDLFVARGVAKARPRDTYKLWEEGVVPSFVLELTSRSTAVEDRPQERRFSASAALQGYRLGAAGYEPIAPDAEGGLTSEELGLRLVVEEGHLQWYDRQTGRRLLDPRERAAAAEARVAELEALLRRLRPPSP